jgi:hypothetical protein
MPRARSWLCCKIVLVGLCSCTHYQPYAYRDARVVAPMLIGKCSGVHAVSIAVFLYWSRLIALDRDRDTPCFGLQDGELLRSAVDVESSARSALDLLCARKFMVCQVQGSGA